jgi:sarcosine oxidase
VTGQVRADDVVAVEADPNAGDLRTPGHAAEPAYTRRYDRRVARTSDVAVLGAGIVGLATAYALRNRGASVHIYERATPGAGQSGGDSRVFRHAHDDLRLIDFAREGRGIYREWQDEFGVELVSGDGVLSLGPAALRRLPLLQRAGVDAVEVGPDELAERMPLLERFEGSAIFDAEGGSIRAAAAVAALVDRLGHSLVVDDVVALWPTGRATIEVRCAGGRGEHGAVVVCAGTNTASLARGLGVSIPVEVSLHGRVSFGTRGEEPPRIACLLDGSDAFGEPGVYGAPSPDLSQFSLGVNGAAAAREDASLLCPSALGLITDRATAYVRRALPGLDPQPVGYRHCWVTELPWHDDAIGVWEAEGILFAAGANLYKHAPALGQALAGAALDGRLDDRLHPGAHLGAPLERAPVGGAAAQRSSFSSSS